MRLLKAIKRELWEGKVTSSATKPGMGVTVEQCALIRLWKSKSGAPGRFGVIFAFVIHSAILFHKESILHFALTPWLCAKAPHLSSSLMGSGDGCPWVASPLPVFYWGTAFCCSFCPSSLFPNNGHYPEFPFVHLSLLFFPYTCYPGAFVLVCFPYYSFFLWKLTLLKFLSLLST